VKYDLVVAVAGDPVQPDANLQSIFVGTGSTLCSLGTIIRRFGFATLDGITSTHTCGATSSDLRAFATL
jgi:hypothetical protein